MNTIFATMQRKEATSVDCLNLFLENKLLRI
jgi:hypothetical protein